jgi:hypothetical protein
MHILLISGFPLTVFIFLSFFNRAPKYHFRIGFIFIYAAIAISMITLFQFTDLLKASVRKIIYGRRNIAIGILPINTDSLLAKRNVQNTIAESNQPKNVEILKYREIKILQ